MIHIILLFLLAGMIQNDNPESVHDFTLNTITGETVSLSDFEGKVLLIVNTASECGFTRQYAGLQELYERYSDNDFVVLGFPADNFGGQEPGSDEDIAEFCERNFGVSFPLFSKISVKGDDQHPLFQYLTQIPNQDFDGDIRWNFEKFLVDQNGELVRRFRSDDEPTGNKIISSVEKLLQ